jgi:hypothetical protein
MSAYLQGKRNAVSLSHLALGRASVSAQLQGKRNAVTQFLIVHEQPHHFGVVDIVASSARPGKVAAQLLISKYDL